MVLELLVYNKIWWKIVLNNAEIEFNAIQTEQFSDPPDVQTLELLSLQGNCFLHTSSLQHLPAHSTKN